MQHLSISHSVKIHAQMHKSILTYTTKYLPISLSTQIYGFHSPIHLFRHTVAVPRPDICIYLIVFLFSCLHLGCKVFSYFAWLLYVSLSLGQCGCCYLFTLFCFIVLLSLLQCVLRIDRQADGQTDGRTNWCHLKLHSYKMPLATVCVQ